jgi:hypothetical protein
VVILINTDNDNNGTNTTVAEKQEAVQLPFAAMEPTTDGDAAVTLPGYRSLRGTGVIGTKFNDANNNGIQDAGGSRHCRGHA